jgi:hypothetical protein
MLHKLSDGTWFYHVPKTGGRAYKAFNIKDGENNIPAYSKDGDHDSCPHVVNNKENTSHMIVGKSSANSKTIRVVIRDPVDRFLSAYYFTKKCSQGGPHKNSDEILRVKNWKPCPSWGRDALDMALKMHKKAGNNVDKLNFFHFNTQKKWHQFLNPDTVIYIDFQDLKFDKFLGKGTGRPSLHEHENLKEITKVVRDLYKKDYEYFEKISRLKPITSKWL